MTTYPLENVQEPGKTATVAQVPAASSEMPDDAPPQPIVCPNCGFEQKKAEECRKCGIIIRKFLERQKKKEETDLSDRMQKKAVPGTGFLSLSKKAILYIWTNNKTTVRSYANGVLEAVLRALVGFAVVGALTTGLIYACKTVWFVYSSSPVGAQYLVAFEQQARLISDLLNENAIRLSIKSSIYAFAVSLAAGAFCHVFHISRYFYYSRGFFGKLVCWGLPLTMIVAHVLRSEFGLTQWGVAYAIALLPTLCLFNICFECAGSILPEIGEVIRVVRQRRSELLGFEQKEKT
ncbi:MAG: hypothetical protein V1736_06150 [Pseudomonadota bacterium]